MSIYAFNDIDNMFEALERIQTSARIWAEKNKAEEIINTHDYYYMWMEGLNIVGKKESGILAREEYDSEEEYQYEIEVTRESIKSGFVFGRWYSEACPEGELGSNHLSRLQLINEEQFNKSLKVIQES